MKEALIVLGFFTVLISSFPQKTNRTCQFNHLCFCTNVKHHVRVDCSNRYIYRIPKFPPTIDILCLHNNSLEIVPDKAFENLHDLLKLDMSSNKLMILSIDAFVGLHNLRQLILEDNDLHNDNSYPIGVFKPLFSLVYLNIKFNTKGRNLLSVIPDYAIYDLVNLEHFEVDAFFNGNILIFGKEFSLLSRLKRIKLGVCEMLEMNNYTFFSMQHLEFIDLSGCKMTEFCAGTLPNRTNLKILDMSNVLMTDTSLNNLIARDFRFTKVQILKLVGIINRSGNLPEWFFTCLNNSGIEELYINNNSFLAAGNLNNAVPTTLKLLDFSNNQLTQFCLNISYLSSLNLKNNTLAKYLEHNSYIDNYTDINNLERIDLSYNQISKLSWTIFRFQHKLKIINLSHNFLSDITFDLSHNINLEFLDLSFNLIKTFDEQNQKMISFISKNLKLKIDITGNIFKCNCRALLLLKWMDDNIHVFYNSHSYKCVTQNEKIIQLNHFHKTILEIEKECKSYVVLISCISIAITACSIAIATGLLYRYRWKIRYFYYMTKGNYNSHKSVTDTIQSYEYDAFISFADTDFDFIKNYCIPQLEINSHLKLCIHNRDFMPGEEITVNITNAINHSRKTICIISRAFLDSYFCKFEFNMARMESIYSRGGENILLLVFYDQILPRELPLVMLELVQEQSYIEYPHDEQGNVVFWEKLKEAIA